MKDFFFKKKKKKIVEEEKEGSCLVLNGNLLIQHATFCE